MIGVPLETISGGLEQDVILSRPQSDGEWEARGLQGLFDHNEAVGRVVNGRIVSGSDTTGFLKVGPGPSELLKTTGKCSLKMNQVPTPDS